MKRRIFFGAVTAALASSIAARAQGPTKKARVGVPIHTTPGSATLTQNINNGSWVGSWDAPGQIYDMEFANGFTHSNGRQLEFHTSNHRRAPGNNTGVRWAEFAASGAPTGGYYWPNNDDRIWETDNQAAWYLPWRQWCILQHLKLIDISGTPSAVKRWPDAAAALAAYNVGTVLDMSDVIDYVLTPPDLHRGSWRSSVNPCCDQNPGSSNFTFNIGGGYWNSYPNGIPSVVRIVADNPNYPGSSTKQLRMRVIEFNGVSPTHMHHGVRAGNYFYWGGTNIHNDGAGGNLYGRLKKFYRVKLTDLSNGIVTQEELPEIPVQPSSAFGADRFAGGWKYGLFCADTTRKKIIYISGQGVCCYTIPADETQMGAWEGPYTFNMTTAGWATTISDGHGNLIGNFAGFIGTHRSDLNKTFFRYNRSKKWHRITWPIDMRLNPLV